VLGGHHAHISICSVTTEILLSLPSLLLQVLSLPCVSSSLGLLAVVLCCDFVIGQHAGTDMIVDVACV
jgi:hypothetical protein